jgi:hypothetical protein
LLLRFAALLAIVGFAAAAGAAEMCWIDSTNEAVYRFKNLKIPKKAGDVVPLNGRAITSISATALPIYGTLLRDENTGDLVMGFTRHFQQCLIGAVLDPETLNGTVSYDCNLDGANDGSFALSFLPGCQF